MYTINGSLQKLTESYTLFRNIKKFVKFRVDIFDMINDIIEETEVSSVRDKYFIYILAMIIVPLAGELKFFPFGGDVRVSLGTPVFFFLLLSIKKLKPILFGFLVGISVIVVRTLLELGSTDTVTFLEALIHHVPVFFYYLCFGTLFSLLRVRNLNENLFLIGVCGAIIELGATIVEIIFRSISTEWSMTFHTLVLICGVAIIRSFFVLSFYSLTIVREAKLSERQQRKQNEENLMLVSDLYVEMVQINKVAQDAEELTSNCIALHDNLKELGNEAESKVALKIAGQMHEIKKDNQRIFAGLEKLMIKGTIDDFMSIEEIIHIISTTNKRYAEMLGKTVEFSVSIRGEHPRYNSFKLTSLINNLVSNSVEAIQIKGKIELTAEIASEFIRLRVSDNGSGISERNRALIFEPSFTTKFDRNGIASNGIGLFHVKNVIEKLGGEINLLESNEAYKTIFEIMLPAQTFAYQNKEAGDDEIFDCG